MTANIVQHVTPRHRSASPINFYKSSQGNWHARPLRTSLSSRFFNTVSSQRGSVTHTTVTVAFSLMSLMCISLLAFVYLQQVFGTATHGTNVQDLESRVIELREEQRALELQGAELRSMQAVEERVRELNLVTVDRVAYLAPETGHVALLSQKDIAAPQ